jgi:hypothetical protein
MKTKKTKKTTKTMPKRRRARMIMTKMKTYHSQTLLLLTPTIEAM